MGKITKSNQKKIGGPITTMKYKLPQNNPLKSNKKCKNHYRNQNIIFLKKRWTGLELQASAVAYIARILQYFESNLSFEPQIDQKLLTIKIININAPEN
jgi:hypothetical protein